MSEVEHKSYFFKQKSAVIYGRKNLLFDAHNLPTIISLFLTTYICNGMYRRNLHYTTFPDKTNNSTMYQPS